MTGIGRDQIEDAVEVDEKTVRFMFQEPYGALRTTPSRRWPPCRRWSTAERSFLTPAGGDT